MTLVVSIFFCVDMPVLFQLKGVLPADKYLLGHYAWTYAVRLTGALLVCEGPVSGLLRVTLEVDGELTDQEFVMEGDGGERRQEIGMELLLNANQRVRWLVTEFDGDIESAAMGMTVTLTAVPQSVSEATAMPSEYRVEWVDRLERLVLYAYASETHQFSEPTPGLAAGRAEIAQGAGGVVITFATGSVVALNVADGAVTVNGIDALGGTMLRDDPRLEFYIDGRRVASVSATGLATTDVSEGALTAGAAQFEFYEGGVLTATLGMPGLAALELREAA